MPFPWALLLVGPVIWALLLGGAGAFAIITNAKIIAWIIGGIIGLSIIRNFFK